ncbi:MAG: hypothetical protein L0Z73_19615 [Gammaproteobacteria bacterium]|nr:hypothetical protein [Gammaproteobacteria bacterium]
MHTQRENTIFSGSNQPAAGFSQLAKSALWGCCLTVKEHVIATHQELAILRRCATLACGEPDQIIHVVSRAKSNHTKFIVNTLMHFGVSCGQIMVRSALRNETAPEGIWLFVANRRPVNSAEN